ncbi:uncharacterized protein UTRI_03414_B [Ustilago trichophora]|uniref:Uncharacterized protein n=1 Tax=Ustilago trichophora TaxID=86804 RepID=A0A5C3E0K3_9BASI|nr:uncharacterized protein UTRI_03414_B [Ustilago trichophora]
MLDPPVQGSVHPLCPSSSAPNSVLSASLSRTTHTSPNTCNSARGSFASTWAHSVSSIRSQPPEPQSAAAPSPLHLANICHRRTRTLDLSTQPHILPRSSSISKNKLRVSFASTTPSSSPSSSSSYHHRSTCSLPISPSMPSTSSAAQVETTPKAGPSRFPISATTMSAKPTSKRNSLLGSISVADRAKKFQSESASVAPPSRPAKSCVRKTSSSPVTQPASVATSAASPSSSPLLPSSQASCSSSQAATSHNNDTAKQSNAVIKHARRISVSTPMHRRARSDASMIDPHFGHDASSSSSASSGSSSNVAATNPPTIRTTSFAEIEELTAKLEANRPRSKTLERPYRGRANSVLMQSIAEENMQLRLCSSTETIRGLNPAGSRASGIDARLALKESHVNFQVSPCLSEDGSIDWHCFVTGNYGVTASFDFRQPISITDLAFPISKRKQVYKSKLAKADSPTLNDEATWLEEELARCSSDEEDDEHNPYGAVRHSIDEEYLTPDGSPLLSPVNVMAPPPVEIMGLGIQDVSLLIPGEQKDAEKSADSLLEQVAMHEACIQTLRTLSHDEREQATAIASATNKRQQLHLGLPSMPDRRSSLVVPPQYPALRGVGSNGDFSATQSDSSALFGEDSYDASMSPMADMGHGAPSNDFSTDSAGERRASAASYLSTDSTASADLSIASHGSSLLFNAHLAAPGMERGGSADTAHSTRPSSIASSYCHDKAPIKPPRSPFRMNSLPLPPLPQEEACETPQLSHQSQVEAGLGKPLRSPLRVNAMPLPPLPHESAAAAAGKPRSSKESTRVLRQASRRKEGTDLPLPPARLDSLDAMVAAAPKEMQLKEEFPDRLLGDWMTAESPAVVEKHEEHGFSVEPVPLHKRIRKQDGTTYLPGLGEIVPPSPDVAANMTLSAQDIPIYPAALKRLGLEPSASMLSPTASAVVANGTGLTKSTTLKSKLSGRLGLSSKEDDSSSLGAGVKVERKVSESSLPNVLGRMRKSSGKNESRLSSAMTLTAAAELPAAWKDRIKRPSIDTRRPSLASLTSSSTHSSSASASSKISGAVQQRATATPLPTIQSHDSRSRSSLGFRKMLSSITGVESIPSSTTSTSTVNTTTTTTPSFSTFTEPSTSAPTTLEALAATTFESPLRRRPSSRSRTQQYQSFIQLSDDEDSPSSSPSSSSSSSSPCSSSVVLPKGSGKKDLTKMFGASQVDLDLSHPPTSAATAREDNKRWTASLGRSSAAKKRSGLW